MAGFLLWTSICLSAGAPITNQAGNDFFAEHAPIRTLEIVISQTNQIELFKDPRAYVPVEIKEGSHLYTNVALHLKGNEGGSFRPLHERPAMTVNFDKFQKGQLFHELDKIYLNNSVEDGSYMAEMLGSELFRRAGVPAPRIGYARVFLNGRDCGLYVVKEGFNKRFLRQHFRNVDGNFYDGGFITDIDEDLSRSSGQGPADNADLEALAAAAQEVDTKKRWARLQSVLDVDRYLSFMAIEVMAGHWDGYTMNRNNYRVYHDPLTDKLVFLPHGMDILFSEPGSSLEPSMDGMVSRAILESREGRRRYRERAREIATNIFDVATLTNRLDQLYAKLHPVIAGLGDQAAREHVAAVQKLRSAILQRTTNLAEAVRFVPPGPLSFDSNHVAALTDWQPEDDSERATMDRPVIDDSLATLHIGVAPKVPTIARWRTRATLPPGRYRMTGRVKTERVMPVLGRPGQGAGIWVRGAPERPTVSRNSPWKELSVDFVVEQEPDELEFSCELLGSDGAAWFDLKSLKVARLPQEPSGERQKN